MEIFRKYKLLLPLIVCTIITLILGVILWTMGGSKSPDVPDRPDAPEGSETEEDPMDNLTFKTDVSAYEPYMDVPSGEYLVLVNKTHTVDSHYGPADPVPVKDAKKSIELERTAAKALEAMFCEMRAEGFRDVFVTSAYRSYEYQGTLFKGYVDAEIAKNPSLTDAQAREKVLRYSAYPGTSEHQTGLAVDLMTTGMRDLDESFADYPVYDWLQENAWKFGFVLRFPEDKVNITGYDYEPWHYRFVGREDAYRMLSQNLCLEEYVEQYKK